MSEKARRQAALLKLVRTQSVRNQCEMVAALKKSGVPSTQASVSRDVRELGIVKVRGRYLPASRLAAPPRPVPRPSPESELITQYEPVGANLVLIHTAPGAASTVAARLDKQRLHDVAGTVAGDDTILAVVRSRTAQGRLLATLTHLHPPRR